MIGLRAAVYLSLLLVWQLAELPDYILSPAVRSQDAKGLIASLLANRDVGAVAWQLLQARWNEVHNPWTRDP